MLCATEPQSQQHEYEEGQYTYFCTGRCKLKLSLKILPKVSPGLIEFKD